VTQPPQRPRDDERAGSGANRGMVAISYLIGGMLAWGLVGWLIDSQWLHTGGVITAIGIVIGMAGGVYLVVRRMGS
jgi:ATP synthase protein I